MPIVPIAPRVFVTTSWDDDDRAGIRVAEMLSNLGLRGTFYVPTGRLGQNSLFSGADLRALSAAGFEIGGHTISHPILSDLRPDQINHEVGGCKKTLEHLLATEVGMFCYPKGRSNAEVKHALRQAGYRGARGTQMLTSTSVFDPFAVPTTLQAYPHQRSNYVRNLLRTGALRVLLNSTPDLIGFKGWLALGKTTFDRVLRDGGVWHLYGHPWEIEKLGLWDQLKHLLEYASRRSGVQYVTNGQLIDQIHSGNSAEGLELQESQPQKVVV